MLNLSHIERDALYIIAGLEEATGEQIHQHLTQYYLQERSESRVRTSLDNLASEGLVEESYKDYRTDLYSITQRGGQALEDHRRWEDQHVQNIP